MSYWQTLTYINSSNSHNYPKGRYIVISILQRTKVRHREVKYLFKIMRRINGALCPGGPAIELELITDAWRKCKYSLGQGEVKFIHICKICDFIPKIPKRIYWKISEINTTAQGSPKSMINILKFPAILNVFPVTTS